MRINIMARVPLLGKTKTRLAATVGAEIALVCYQRMLDYTLTLVQQSGFEYRIFWTEPFSSFESDQHNDLQQGDDLGDRMYHCFQQGVAAGFTQQIIIGTDCPTLTIKHLESAKAILDKSDNVIGPSTDGGYYLFGMNGLHADVFTDMTWSTATVAEETHLRLRRRGATVQELPALTDVDREEDLKKFPQFFAGLVPT